MGKERKKRKLWEVLLRGCLLSLAVYLPGVPLLALLVGKGVLPEKTVLLMLGLLCVVSGLCGGLLTVRSAAMGRLPAGLLSGVVFASVLLVAGACLWPGGFSWSGSGGGLMGCGLLGGVLSGFLGGRKRRGGKRLRK